MVETVELIRRSSRVNVSCGASNISFGMPDRRGIDSAFLTIAIATGMNTAITNPLHIESRKASSPPTCCSDATSTARTGSRCTAPACGRGGERWGRADRMTKKVEVTYRPSGKTVRARGHDAVQRGALGGLPIESDVRRPGHVRQVGQGLSGHIERTLADYRHLNDRLDEGWRLSCQAEITEDRVRGAPPDEDAEGGDDGRRPVRAARAQRGEAPLELPPPSLEDHRSHLARVLDAVEEAGYGRNYDWEVLPRVAQAFRRPRRHGDAGGEYLVDVEAGDTTDRVFGASFDIGTTTCVCTLVDLRNGATVGVASTINHQAPFGADVIARMAKAMHGEENVLQLRDAAISTLNELLGRVRQEGVEQHEIYEAVVAGNATMMHLLCGVNPESLALAPYVATFLEPQDLRADQAGFDMHPSAGSRYSRRSARTSAPTSSPTSWRPGSCAIRRPGCWSTSARTARSRAGTRSAAWRRPRRPARRSRAARSSTACGPPTARSRA